MDLKKLKPYAQLIIIGFVIVIFLPILGIIDIKYVIWFMIIVAIAVVFYYIFRKRKIKSEIEKFYEAVIKNTAANEEGTFGDPDTNLRLNNLEMLSKEEGKGEGKISYIYTFKMGCGNSKSQYEKYKEGLEQFLDAPVEFSFDQNLIITVFKKPLDKYK